MSKKSILYFMPDCPVKRDAGNKARTFQLLEYFESRHDLLDLHFVGESHWGQWVADDIQQFKQQFPNCDIHVLDRKLSKKNKLKYIFSYKIPNYFKKNKWFIKREALSNHNTHILQKAFNSLLRKKKYDYIIISYVSWATLIEKNPFTQGIILINDAHDFITAQLKNKRNFKLGESFEREMKLLSLFDEVWTVSSDEQYLYSQFVASKHRFVPVMYPNNYNDPKFHTMYEYDLLFVGSENEHNIKALNWFFEKVYALLPSSLRIGIIGKICSYVADYPNVNKMNFVEDLSTYYYKSKIALCPMLSGTGVKVKVVEALSYGLPVVCNLRGLDGLPLKENNGCLRGDTPEEFAKHITKLLADENYYQSIKKLAINTFKDFFDKKHCYDQLDAIFQIEGM